MLKSTPITRSVMATSSQHVVDDPAFGQQWQDAARAVGQCGFRIDAEQVVDRGQDVLGRVRPVRDGAADPCPSCRPLCRGQCRRRRTGRRVRLRPVIATATERDVLDLRRPGRVRSGTEPASSSSKPRRWSRSPIRPARSAVEARHQLVFHARVVVPVCVPAGAGQAELVPEDRDEARAGLDQSPGREGGLAKDGHAVGFAVGAAARGPGRGPASPSRSRSDCRPSAGSDPHCGRCRRRPDRGGSSRVARRATAACRVDPVSGRRRQPFAAGQGEPALSGRDVPMYGSATSIFCCASVLVVLTVARPWNEVHTGL